MAMEVQGSRRHHRDAGVKVKFIETQFISSDAASFKAVVQRLTGKSPAASPQPALAPQPQPLRPRPCRPAFVAAAHQLQADAGWHDGRAFGYMAVPAPKHEPIAAAPCLEEMHELCDFADLFYTTAAVGARGDGGGSAFQY
ncbi:hypothetical protein BS78_10G136700 [Paspalum vaginatum]|nr:hypothetical protein BS78_10G136700 [Paspalum vaginatum]